MRTYEPLDARVRELEPEYQSEAEARIGRMLDRYGIPFFYRQPRLIYDRGYHDIWHPSFTLPQYDGLIVDYADPASGLDYAERRLVYHANGIAAVVAEGEKLGDPQWQEDLLQRIHSEYQRAQAEYRHQQTHGYLHQDVGFP